MSQSFQLSAANAGISGLNTRADKALGRCWRDMARRSVDVQEFEVWDGLRQWGSGLGHEVFRWGRKLFARESQPETSETAGQRSAVRRERCVYVEDVHAASQP